MTIDLGYALCAAKKGNQLFVRPVKQSCYRWISKRALDPTCAFVAYESGVMDGILLVEAGFMAQDILACWDGD